MVAYAVSSGNLALLEYLLSQKACNYNASNAFVRAACRGDLRALDLLLADDEKKAALRNRNRNRRRPGTIAVR